MKIPPKRLRELAASLKDTLETFNITSLEDIEEGKEGGEIILSDQEVIRFFYQGIEGSKFTHAIEYAIFLKDKEFLPLEVKIDHNSRTFQITIYSTKHFEGYYLLGTDLPGNIKQRTTKDYQGEDVVGVLDELFRLTHTRRVS